jgi:uncharacterized Ntn-hydrolase superfamily protein
MSMRPAHTYSIVAYDPESRRWGVAVQTHYFGVGASVPWAEPSVGAVATQSLTEPSYGPQGLALMREGKTAEEALRALVSADARPEVRQVAMVDSAGRPAAHTGERCIPMAGHHLGPTFVTQANLMRRPTVWDAMAEAFVGGQGDLAERMLQALEAAESEGGDIRGRQSAALIVVGTEAAKPWERVFDLRVDDHRQPLLELRRLMTAARVYEALDRATDVLEIRPVTDDARRAAAADFERVRDGLASLPGNVEPIVWYAVELANAGRLEEALPLFAEVYRGEPVWREVVPRLVAAGLLNVGEGDLARILVA